MDFRIKIDRQVARTTVTAAIGTLLVIAASVGGWRLYAEWRLGRIELTTEDAPVVCQVLAESSDSPIGEPFDLVTRAVVALPAGDYRLHVSGKGRLSRTYRFAVNRGETQTHTISIDEGRLLGGEWRDGSGGDERPPDVPILFAPVTAALELIPGKADLIEWSGESVIRRDGVWGNVLWDTLHPAKPFDPNQDPAPWTRNLSAEDGECRLLEHAPDLNGDGTRDLLWFFPNISSFLALSGKDGSMLWNYIAELDGPGGPDGPESNRMEATSVRTSEIIGKPALADVDRDGAPDVIATIVFAESTEETARRPAPKSPGVPAINQEAFQRRVVLAVSGRTGRWLWSYAIDKSFISIPHETSRRSAAHVEGRRRALVEVVDGTQWLGLEAATGRPQAGPFDLGFIPTRPVQHADFDGDGEPEILALGPGPTVRQSTLHAFSIESGRELWSETVGAAHEQFRGGPPLDFPLIADLDENGRFEIVVPDSGPLLPLSGYRGVKLLEGLTGKVRWRRPLRPDTKVADGLTAAIAAPDLDGDGTRDIATVSLFAGKNPSTTSRAAAEEPARAYVDAISGKDGRPLWWWHVDLPARKFTRFWPLYWWSRGPDGWPLLAVPLGGAHPDGTERTFPRAILNPPIVHLLEASTGRERHTIAGLSRASIADLDGDGLADLWGKVDGEVRAFRGEAPEAWRALEVFYPAGRAYGRMDATGNSSVDFDRDGIGDTLLERVDGPRPWLRRPTGSHTALARSGRDGRVIWKAVIDPRRRWFEPEGGDSDWLSAFPLPAGDFNGDGTPDVIVSYRLAGTSTQTATLRIQLLSGRNGALLWRAGPLPLGFDAQGYSQIHSIEAGAVELGGSPDLFVRHESPFVKPGSTPPPAAGPRMAFSPDGKTLASSGSTPPPAAGPRMGSAGRPSLARVSGRDGRILWNISLAEGLPLANQQTPPAQFVDLNSDGGLDALVAVPPNPGAGEPDDTIVAVSLRDGTRLWSQPVNFWVRTEGEIRVGDVNGDKRPDVVVLEKLPERNKGELQVRAFDGEELPERNKGELQVRAFDGRDGKLRWTWSSAALFQNDRPSILLAQLDGTGTNSVCVNFRDSASVRRIVILDGHGKERRRPEVRGEFDSVLRAADLNGDGRDELVVSYGNRLRAWSADLKEIWSRSDESASIDQILPASAGRPGAVIMNPGACALDGATGEPRWTGQAPLVALPAQFAPELLDPGDAARLPLLIANGLGATVCRVALPTTPQGAIAPPRGKRVKVRRLADDPRWTRPLPWLMWLKGFTGPWAFLAAVGLALVNVALPLLVLRLVGGRRRFSIRALMALPVAAAIPLMGYLVLEPVLPVGSTPLLASEKRLFTVGTLAGLPIVFCVIWMASSLLRRRGKPALGLAGLMVLASLTIAAVWLWVDMRSMATLEHYGSTGWYLVALPGTYAAAIAAIFARAILGLYRLVKRHRTVADTHNLLI
jgi:hypothetical protein